MSDWRQYLQERQKKSMPPQRFKLVLVGQEGAGKTTLLKSLQSKSGKVTVKENLSTDGINEQVLRFPAVMKAKQTVQAAISIQCFDFAGQEIYYPSHELFMSRRCIFVVVCSARELLDGRENAPARARYWLQKVKAFIGESRAPVLLVVTGWDLVARKEVDALHKISHQEVIGGMQLELIGPVMVSCRTGFGIKALQSSIESVARNPVFFPNISEYTIQVEAQLRSLTTDQFGRVSVAAAEAVGENLMRTRTALEYLKATGAILHFEGTRERPDTACYIVRPIALADLFKDILTFRSSFVRNGELSEEELFIHIWKSKDAQWIAAGQDPAREKSILVDVLEQFELVVRSSKAGKLLVPSLLPEEISPWYNAFWGVKAQEVGRSIEMKFVLRGFFPKILHRCFNLGTQVEIAWRSGVLLSWREALGSVVMSGMTLNIRVRYEDGKSGIILFGQLLSVVESVFESYGMGDEWQRLPMTVPFRNVDVDYAHCVRSFQRGKKEIVIGSERVSLGQLIPEVTLSHLTEIVPSEVTLGRVLGEGAFGLVYAGQWRGVDVAVKVAKNHAEGNDLLRLIRDFTREAEVMSRLEHPCLMRLLGLVKLRAWSLPGMVMELINGGNLAEDFHFPEPSILQVKGLLKVALQVKKCLSTLLAGEAIEGTREELKHLQPDLCARLFSQGWNRELTTAALKQVSRQIEIIRTELNPRMLQSDRRIAFSVRVRLLLDVLLGLEFLHNLSPPFVHNDLRSPNVFLLQIARSDEPVAKLADYGLTRVAAGGVKMGLDSWQWLAPEVLDPRHAATFTVQADIYSFGIVAWEVLNGAGINLPFVEYEKQFKNLTDIKHAIREVGLRPSMTSYAEDLFAQEPMYQEMKALIQRCLESNPSERPRASEAAYELKKMLGIAATPPQPRILRSPELSLVRSLCFELGRVPRSPNWVCGDCEAKNEKTEKCRCQRNRPTPRVMQMEWCRTPWLGLKNGKVVEVLKDAPNVYSFSKETPVLGLCSNGSGVWAATDTELMYIEAAESKTVNLERTVGTVVGVVANKDTAWVFQTSHDTSVSIYRKEAKVGSLKIGVAIRCTHGHLGKMLAMGEASALLYQDGVQVHELRYAKKISPVCAWIGQDKICIGTATEILQFSAGGQLLHRVEAQANVRSVCGAWIGTVQGVHSRAGRTTGNGEMSCLLAADGLLWAVDNTARLLCAYKEVVPATF